MKVKLLKIIRRRFSINHYPNRKSKNYVITDHHKGGTLNDPFDRFHFDRSHDSINEAISVIFSISYVLYHKYSRKYKQSKVKQKVWYNG